MKNVREPDDDKEKIELRCERRASETFGTEVITISKERNLNLECSAAHDRH